MASIYGSTSGYLGRLAAILGRWDEALEHMKDDAEILTRLGARMWIAANLQYTAEILIRRGAPGDVERAVELLNRSIELARRHDCEIVVARALSLKLELQGVASRSTGGGGTIHTVHASVQSRRPDISLHAGSGGMVTIVFSDMEGFTAMTERLGDHAAHEVIRRHNAVVREQTSAHGGAEVELQGDGFLLAFGDAAAAVRCAVAIQRAFDAQNQSGEFDEPIRVRIGLHTGQAIRDKDRFFGRTVILAARIADQAKGGTVLASADVKSRIDARDEFSFAGRRLVDLKGISGAQEVFEVAWA
jgi:class 3 adenylate cyclase